MASQIETASPIEITGICAGYSEFSWSLVPRRRVVIENVSLSLQASEIIGIVGGNGTGKTTLLRAVVDPQSRFDGEVLCSGKPLGRGTVGYVPQAAALSLSSWLRVKAEIALPLRIRGLSHTVSSSMVA